MKSTFLALTLAGLAVLLGASFLFFYSVTADSIEWVSDPEEAQALAVQTGKPVIVYFHTEWCGYCQRMEQETFRNRGFLNTTVPQYTWLSIDLEKEPIGPKLGQKFAVRSYPTTVLLDEQGEEMGRMVGFVSAREFQRSIQKFSEDPDSFGNLRRRASSQQANLQDYFTLGQGYIDRQDYQAAAGQFGRIIELAGEDRQDMTEQAYYWRAFSLSQIDASELALQELAVFEERFPQSDFRPRAILLKSKLLYFSGEETKARAILAGYLEQYPDHPLTRTVQETLRLLETQEPSTTSPLASSH